MARFVGLRIYDGADGQRHFDAILQEGTVRLIPEGADMARQPGYYNMEWQPVPDPTELQK
jgi:hypothetical protein